MDNDDNPTGNAGCVVSARRQEHPVPIVGVGQVSQIRRRTAALDDNDEIVVGPHSGDLRMLATADTRAHVHAPERGGVP